MKNNEDRITIADIAREAGVSAMTVSRLLSGKGPVALETADRIRKIIKRLGYQPNYLARSLSSRRSMVLGVAIPRTEHALLDNYISQVLSGITDTALHHEYRIMLFPFNPEGGDQEEFANLFRSKMVDGLLLLKTFYGDGRILSLARQKIPFVLVNHKYYGENVHFIDVNNMLGAKLAVEYLAGKGHRNIAFISGDLRETNARDRLNGFRKTMQALGLPIREHWIIQGQFDQRIAYQNCAPLFEGQELPTAVFCSDDYMAIGVMHRLKELGLRIPEDVSVIGFDDIELAAYVKPALTTIRQPLQKIGKIAAETLLKMMGGEQIPPTRRLLKVKLVQRESA